MTATTSAARIAAMTAGLPPRLTTAGAKKFAGCGDSFLKQLRRDRKIQFFRLGHRSVSYSTESLARYLLERESAALGQTTPDMEVVK